MIAMKRNSKLFVRLMTFFMTLLVFGLFLWGCSGMSRKNSNITGKGNSSCPERSVPVSSQTVPDQNLSPSQHEPEHTEEIEPTNPPARKQPTTPANDSEEEYVKGEIVLGFHPYVTEEEVRAVVAAHGCTIALISTDIMQETEGGIFAFVKLPEGKDEDEAIREFLSEETVRYAEKDWYRHAD